MDNLLNEFSVFEDAGFNGEDECEHSEQQDEHDPDDLLGQDGNQKGNHDDCRNQDDEPHG